MVPIVFGTVRFDCIFLYLDYDHKNVTNVSFISPLEIATNKKTEVFPVIKLSGSRAGFY